MDAVIADVKTRMEKASAALDKEFSHLRTGRASVALLDGIKVDYYGTPTPIDQLASVSTPDSRTITIQPWDRAAFGLIEKAIQKSDLGLNPVNDGKIIRIGMPPLTEDRRKELVKVAKKYTEEGKVAVRNIRRDANDALKKKLKDKSLSEDDVRKGEAEIQKITDSFVAKLDQQLAKKEKEIMEI
ncbi:ribosome recycling factor [Fundidesulfovibrio agrisoli]|uniref:ribosome recycling factor n=1 Tax=Fundidesulfovibrio agrisoli TaxID=2922717 RepID=UPI001FAC59F4|nr:ribosome recycling factor [Fundidesulfovibrio agrisoli]